MTFRSRAGEGRVSFLREVDLGKDFPPYVEIGGKLGFIPNLYRAQSLLPYTIEALAELDSAILLREKALSRVFKEQLLLCLCASWRSSYCVAQHSRILSSLGVPEAQIERLLADDCQAGLSPAETALLDYGLKLSHYGPWIRAQDVEKLRALGHDYDSIYEAALVTALASYICTLAAGLAPEPDAAPRKLPSGDGNAPGSSARIKAPHGPPTTLTRGPYVPTLYRSPMTFRPFKLLQESHGYVPNFFRAQTMWPEMVEPVADAVVKILMPEDVLSRAQKEYILLAVSAANLNSYCVAVHCNLLRGLGVSPEEGDQIAVDYRESVLSPADKAMVDFALKVTARPSEFGRQDIEGLRARGFTEEQVLECLAVTALNNFANTLQLGLGIVPDFEPPEAFEQKKLHLSAHAIRPTPEEQAAPAPARAVEDPDAGLVAEAQGGNLDAFEALVRRHSRTVYRCLMAILGNPDEAQDAMQDAFLSAFRHIARFQGRSKFSTWLVSITRNTALQRLRDRREMESLDEQGHESEAEFRPRQVRAWGDDPERMYSQSETQQIVQKAIMGLPANYRVAVILRDVEQFRTDEVAKQLGLSVPALKARLLRGRLMLREALSPYFAEGVGRSAR
jgi:RNA polymerase sigma-70 factor (ECF subfamily)